MKKHIDSVFKEVYGPIPAFFKDVLTEENKRRTLLLHSFFPLLRSP